LTKLRSLKTFPLHQAPSPKITLTSNVRKLFHGSSVPTNIAQGATATKVNTPKPFSLMQHPQVIIELEFDKAWSSKPTSSITPVIKLTLPSIKLWDASVAEDAPKVRFKELKDGEVDSRGSGSMVHAVLKRIVRVPTSSQPYRSLTSVQRRYGFCYISNVPATPSATEALLRRISFIRETHYGGFYDFTADLASKDTAYTNIALEAHTDTTYFSDPAGLQAFHLLSHTEGSGGSSLLVDGFNAAKQLLFEDREAYETLATVNVHAHASGNAGISIMPYRGFPVLEHDRETGSLLQVRWNSSDRASIELPLGEVGRWYDAARKFDRILKKKENELWEQLQPGTVVIFDNWRVLHGRSEFTGKRRICGGYISRDDWVSKFKMMNFGPEEVLGSLASG